MQEDILKLFLVGDITYQIKSNEPKTVNELALQSHGSEILRRAIIDLDNKNFEISMPVHDAVLIHCEKKNLRAM